MNFITDFLLLISQRKAHNSIFIIINCCTKITKYILVCKTITAEDLADIYLQCIIINYSISKFIVINRNSVFTSKF